MTSASHLIFVYGTLKRGAVNHRHLADAVFVADAATGAGYTLYQLDGYPGMIRDPGDANGVRGELWQVGAACLARLDEFEGVPEGLYRREPVQLAPPHAGIGCETYLYARSVEGCPKIGSGWTIG